MSQSQKLWGCLHRGLRTESLLYTLWGRTNPQKVKNPHKPLLAHASQNLPASLTKFLHFLWFFKHSFCIFGHFRNFQALVKFNVVIVMKHLIKLLVGRYLEVKKIHYPKRQGFRGQIFLHPLSEGFSDQHPCFDLDGIPASKTLVRW